MTDPIRVELAEALHAATLGEGVACDYHQRPKKLEHDEPVLLEAMRLVDHPQLQIEQWPEDWVIDAARCTDHAVDEIVAPTRGFEEALISVSLTVTNGVVSVSAPEVDDVQLSSDRCALCSARREITAQPDSFGRQDRENVISRM